jgi:predicted trehalose synthase
VYLVEGDCGERVLALYGRDGRPAESDPTVLRALLAGAIEGFSVECRAPAPHPVAVDQVGSGPRGDVFEASAPPYGRLHVKVMRRLPGHMRESLYLGYLSSQGFPLAPRLICRVAVEGSDYIVVSESVEGEPLAHIFVEAAARSIQGEAIVPPEASSLGYALAYLHSIAARCAEPWCRPRASTVEDAERWLSRLKGRAAMLRRMASSLPRDEAMQVSEAADALEGIWEEMRRDLRSSLSGRTMMAVHGDFHLYQVFRGPGGRLVITDFEGEPSREPADPMELEPPERDFAALARSLDYARALAYMAARGSDAWEAAREAKRILSRWLEAVLRAVAAAYRAAGGLGALGVHAAFWLAERASYEAVYELKYSTGLHPIPLEAIIRMWEGSDDVSKTVEALS